MARSMINRFWTQDVYDRLETLYCVEGLDLEDIARDLGRTPRAVWSQINSLGLRRTLQAVQARRERGYRSKRWDTPTDREYTKLMRNYD
jgi:biotin operon repressor